MPFGSHVQRAYLLWLRCWFLGTESAAFYPLSSLLLSLLYFSKPPNLARAADTKGNAGWLWRKMGSRAASSICQRCQWWDRWRKKRSHFASTSFCATESAPKSSQKGFLISSLRHLQHTAYSVGRLHCQALASVRIVQWKGIKVSQGLPKVDCSC